MDWQERAVAETPGASSAYLVAVAFTGMTSLERSLIGRESGSLMRFSKRSILVPES